MKLGQIKNKEVIIITKYFLPNKSVDSLAVMDLINDLIEMNPKLTFTIITTNDSYKSNLNIKEINNNIQSKIKCHFINNNYFKFLPRFLKDFIEGFLLVNKAKNLTIKNVISLTNPPLISFWCALLLNSKKYFYWSFDLYPEAIISSKILDSNNILIKFITKIIYENKPFGIISMGPKQLNYLIQQYEKYENKIEHKFILPCGIHTEIKESNEPYWYDKNKINIGYLGNLGKAHSKEFLINIINASKIQSTYKLIFSIYGEHANEIKNYVKKNKKEECIEFVDFVKQAELGYLDIHLVSLLNDWTNISVPSKAVSAICSNSTIWFNGKKESDTYFLFKDCLIFSENDLNSIEKILENLKMDEIVKLKIKAQKSAESLLTMKSKTLELLNELF